MRTISLQEVAQHNKKDDAWVILHGRVYDLTSFLPDHPGGQKIIMKYAGKDGTKAFEPIHPPDIIDRYLSADVCVGHVVAPAAGEEQQEEEAEDDKRLRLAREKMPRLDEMYNAFDFESVAKTILKTDAWYYFSSGADDEVSMRENHNAFHRVWLRPRVMVDVAKIDMNTTMLGDKVSMPLYLSATALGKMAHPDGEKVLARAAGKCGVIQMIPTFASCSMDEIVNARIQPNQSQWLQLYVNPNREMSRRIIEQAEAKGVKGLFITVDTATVGRREKDLRQKYTHEGPSDMQDGDLDRSGGTAKSMSSLVDMSLNWSDIAWFRSLTNMPIVLKGIQTGEDAVLAARHKVAGIVISNHGGRQLDFAPSPIEILPEVMDALKRERLENDIEVYIDGGIRRGSDIFKAIALGAKAVGIGRPYLYAMACYGEKGVERLLDLYQNELEMCMRLMGTPTLAHIKPEMVDIRNLKDHFVANPTDYLAKHAYERMQPRGNFSKL
ncbi:FMN-dependent dehydrogenase-domain-containing protein [Zychaea mexicana]|uniref:FMN-dependent dehydrogenase-domain-containing protein n=1 Tax=Zychaea mexicana TaxID=64656 RepID=UPI0022FDCBB7|nr:FMN-dependent dehydrogenase-domain-containing protein [Zychaea mexicana]KAI9497404.1 FMN-dependent dehydrogenase-domain-containing protein [Zychaea mexicana]